MTGLNVLATSPNPGSFVLEPQAPLPSDDVTLATVAGATFPNVVSGEVAVQGPALGKWTFKLRTAGAADFKSLTGNDVGDVLLLVSFQVD